MWHFPAILLLSISSSLRSKTVIPEQDVGGADTAIAPPKVSERDMESMKDWGMSDKQIQDAMAFSSKAVDPEEEAALSLLVNMLSEQELNSITEMSEPEMEEFFRELAEDRRWRTAKNFTTTSDPSEQRSRVRQLLLAFIKDPPSQKRRRRDAGNPPMSLLKKAQLYEDSKKAREPTLTRFEIKSMANSMKSTLGRIQKMVDQEKQIRHARKRRDTGERSSKIYPSAQGLSRSHLPLIPPSPGSEPLRRLARSLFFHGSEEEEEERVVPTYYAPDFVPSPQFLSETISARTRRSLEALSDGDQLTEDLPVYDFHEETEVQDEGWGLQSAHRGGDDGQPQGPAYQADQVSD